MKELIFILLILLPLPILINFNSNPTVMINHQHLLPLSLNPEAKPPNPSSPLHFLTSRKTYFLHALHHQQNQLNMHVDLLKQHIESKKKHQQVIEEQIKSQEEKISFWKQNFQRVQAQYAQKAEKIQHLKVILEHKKTKKMKNDDQEDFSVAKNERKLKKKIVLKGCSAKKGSRDENQANYSFQRIKSIVLKNKETTRGKTLSLTHLHVNN